jgi:hypothetical protein
MKTKIFLFLITLLAGVQLKANTNDVLPVDLLKAGIQETIEQEAYKWDYSLLKEKTSLATIAFRISPNGEVTVSEIATNDEGFKQLIENNLPKVKFTAGTLSSEEVFYIQLKHKTV